MPAVYERPLLIVYGTPRDSSLRTALRDAALYLANSLAASHATYVRALTDLEYRAGGYAQRTSINTGGKGFGEGLEASDGSRYFGDGHGGSSGDENDPNLILLGGPSLNKLARAMYAHRGVGSGNASIDTNANTNANGNTNVDLTAPFAMHSPSVGYVGFDGVGFNNNASSTIIMEDTQKCDSEDNPHAFSVGQEEFCSTADAIVYVSPFSRITINTIKQSSAAAASGRSGKKGSGSEVIHEETGGGLAVIVHAGSAAGE